MQVQVLLFARMRDLVGSPAVSLELPHGAVVAHLRQELAKQYPAAAALMERSTIALNNQFASNQLVIPVGAELAVIPPVSGG